MSIEPASVSNPVVRDNENGSLRMAGNGTQGSATGRKEGQFGSFWEKAVYGAQKLFGIERSSTDGLEEQGSDEESNSRDEARPEGDAGNRLRRPVALSQSRSIGLGGFRADAVGSMPSFGATDPRFESPPETESTVTRQNERSPKENAVENRDEKPRAKAEDSVESREVDEEEEGEAKSADPVMPVLPARSELGQPVRRETLLNTEKQTLREGVKQVGINSARQAAKDPIMTSLPKVQLPQDSAPSDLSPVAANEKAMPSPMTQQSESGPRVVEVAGQSANAAVVAKTASAGVPVNSEFAKPINTVSASETQTIPQADSKATVRGKSDEVLSMNAEKAKANVSEALSKRTNSEHSKSQVSRETKPADVKPTGSELFDAPKNSGDSSSKGDIEAKLNDSMPKGPQKSPMAPLKASEVAKSVANANAAVHSNSETAGQESSSTKKPEAVAGQDFARDFKGTEVRSVDLRANANRSRPTQAPLGASVAGLQANAVTSAKAGSGAQSQGNSFGSSEKQTPEMSALRESAPKTNASNAKADSAQGFQLSNSQGASASKSSFAAKSQPTSYASKGTEEVKEIYATLTKSVERLVNTKGDTISLRINFDQGGTMALRVSMDGGQVNTTMQTDLAGLESLIKSNWSELASDWNAKGVKLNAPQFTQGNGEGARDDGSMNFEQRESQSQNGSSNGSKSRNANRSNVDSSPSNSGSQQNDAESEDQAVAESGEQELLTYA